MAYAMLPSADPLDDLRREIDRLDDAMLDLLLDRVALVRRIGLVKGDRAKGALAMRPAREAAILRRLTDRAGGRLPAATIVAMWRELLGATTRLQTPFAVAVYVPPDRPGIWDVTRGHFGHATPLLLADRPGNALRQLAGGGAQLAVLPLPDETELWWRAIAMSAEPPLRIVARLPFCAEPGDGQPPAVVVAALPPEPSGDDVTVMALEVAVDTSRQRLVDLLTKGRLPPRWLATVREPEPTAALHLFEVDGFLTADDAELAAALAPLAPRVLRVMVVGSYARPLTPSAAERMVAVASPGGARP